MKSRRIHRALRVEQLEPRIAPSAVGELDLVTRSGVGYDFNGDGFWDVLTYDRQTGNLFVDLMNADGESVGAPDKLGTHFIGQQKDPSLELCGAGNWLGAGRTDILWHNTVTGEALVWQMAGMTITGATVSLGSTNTHSRTGGVADMDGNGTADPVWQDTTTGDIAFWAMDGTSVLGVVAVGQGHPSRFCVVAAGDINADGQADLLAENLDATQGAYKALIAWLITPGDPAGHTAQGLGTVSDAAHDYRVGGITKLQADATSNILLRGVDSLANAAFVDWKMDASLTATPRQIYERAPVRAAFMTADAIASLPLTPDEASDDLIAILPSTAGLQWRTFDIGGVPTDHVLLQTWTDYAYTGKETSVRATSQLWCSVGFEMKQWYAEHDVAWEDLFQRTAQLLGMPTDTTKYYFVEIWVAPRSTPTDTLPHASIWRPTPDPDYTNHSSTMTMPPVLADPSYRPWYENWVDNVSYELPTPGKWDGGYPWTRLGYTYDWGGDPYANFGLSEFLVPGSTPIVVNDLIPNEVYWGRIYGTVVNVAAGQSYHYTDADGDYVTVTLTGRGTLELILPEGGVGNAIAMNMTGTDERSSLSISVRQSGRGDGETTVGTFKVGTFCDPASLRSITGTRVSLAQNGEVLVTGWIGSVALQDAPSRLHVAIGGSADAAPLRFQIGRVADASITSDTPILLFKAIDWRDTDSVKDQIKAPWAGTVRIAGDRRDGVAGDFQANVTLTGGDNRGVSLNQLIVVGAISGSAISYQRAAGSLERGWINAISAAQWETGSIAANRLGSLRITGGDFGANITLNGLNVPARVKALGSVRIAGDLVNNLWKVEGDVGQVRVGGTADHSTIRAAGGIAGVRLGASDTSDILAGVRLAAFEDGRRHATSAADFADAQATIGPMQILGWPTRRGQPRAGFLADSHFTSANFGAIALLNAESPDAYTIHVLGREDHVAMVQYRDTADAANNWRWRPGRPWGGGNPLDVIV